LPPAGHPAKIQNAVIHDEVAMTEHNERLSPEFIARQKQRLEELRAQLLGMDQAAGAQDRNFHEEHADEPREAEDDGQDMAGQEVQQALHDVNQRRLNDINRALEKIANGTYGISDASGKPIPKARLEAIPEALRTVQE
jgi:DnaK suppressor protein